MPDFLPLGARSTGQTRIMNGTGESKSPGFMAFLAGVVGILLSAYIVFICLKMARTPGSRETLLALAVALGLGALAGALGFAGLRRKR